MRELSERILQLLRDKGLHGHVTYGTGTIAAVIVVMTEKTGIQTLPPLSGDTGLLWEDHHAISRRHREMPPPELKVNVALKLPR